MVLPHPFGLVFATMSIKGPEDGIGAFRGLELGTLILLLAAAIALAPLSLYRILRAANGPSWLDAYIKQLAQPYDAERYLRRAGGAAHDLKIGQVLWVVSLFVFFLTVVLVWVL